MTREQLLKEIRKLGIDFVISRDTKNIISLRFWVEDEEEKK
jgi:hypothetical protein